MSANGNGKTSGSHRGNSSKAGREISLLTSSTENSSWKLLIFGTRGTELKLKRFQQVKNTSAY